MTFLRFLLDGHEGRLIDVPGIAARYVRRSGNGNTESDPLCPSRSAWEEIERRLGRQSV
jgi:hypothetical protein